MESPDTQPTFTVDGNRLTLLDTGPRRLEAVLALIAGARASLRMIFYIYADDRAGRRVNAALIEARARGVAVSLVVDGFGAASDPAFFRPLEEAGVALCRFAPRFGRRYLLRNHQKLALADAGTDDARIIVGGFNIEDDYFGTPADQAWRDLGLLVEGPAASRMAGYFDTLAQGIRGGGRVRRLNRALGRWSETNGGLRWVIGGPTRRLSPWARAIKRDMRHARRIDLIAAYFMPSPMLLRRIERAGRSRGRRARAEVRVVTAAKSDNSATIAAARFTYAGLLRRGIRLFEYQPTKLHTKLYVVDHATWIGSANFDMRSLFINLELMLRIDDAAFADHVRGYIDGEVAQSVEVTREGYRRETDWWQRVKQFAAYLLMAVADPAVSRGLNWGIDEDEA